jgi:hypothetical protein
MCDPVSLGLIAAATFAVGAASDISQYMGEKQAYKVNQQVANLNYANNANIIQQKRVQLDQEKSEKAVDTAITTVRAEGAVSAAAGSMGLSSSSIVQAINADMFGIGRQFTADETNDQNQRLQLANELSGADIERRGKIASVSKPGLGTLGIAIAGDAVKGVGTYVSMGGT